MEKLKDIRTFTEEQLKEALVALGEKSFRANQVYEWLWNKAASTFDEMTNLSLELREKLKLTFSLNPIKTHLVQVSSDKTVKCAFKLWDDSIVEGVLIPAGERMTACVSSQVGCSLNCKFCATGYIKRERSLSAGEIYDQVVGLNEISTTRYKKPLSNIVFMGMGEPLLNYAAVMGAIDKIVSPKGLGISAKRITLSTAGIAKMIKKLADDNPRINLALSLHSANNEKRSSIMPINESNSLEELLDALNYFYDKTQNRPTLEYALMKGVNDQISDAKELVAFAQKVPCKINIIEYNPIDFADYKRADYSTMDNFVGYLEKSKQIVNVRRSRGKDIDAACGQLANKL